MAKEKPEAEEKVEETKAEKVEEKSEDKVEAKEESKETSEEKETKDEEKSEEKTEGEEKETEDEEKSEEEKPEEVEKFDLDYEPEQFSIDKKVGAIVFGMMSPKRIKKMAAAKIVTPELYDKEGYPVDGGIMDIRLGVIDPGLKCKTCGSKLKECTGHFGYIEMARPVIHIHFTNVILSLMRATCRDCSRILIPKNKIEKFKEVLNKAEEETGLKGRRAEIKNIITLLRTTNKCPHCQARQQKVVIEKPTTFIENEKRISPIEIRARLEKVQDDDLELFGINPEAVRPEWTILTVLPIPPVTMRPSITLETGERSEDDLTHKLGDIVRINQRLFENINAGAPEIIIEDLWDLLQYHITTYFDNSVSQLPPARHRSGEPLKTLSERIKSKEGRIRQNLAGKRTNFCARTVISPDPSIRISEVGVPTIVATKLTVPEMVTSWNAEYLKGFIKNGPKKYPGANYVIRPDGRKKKLTDDNIEVSLEEIQPGYVVERHLIDGDMAVFNRQPSLHRMSMMCHRVRVLPGRTLRLNPAVCHPYNADFDGDEMNLHIPQTEEARAEAEILMEVQTQLVSPRYGLSVMGCIQDAISGNFILTKEIPQMSRREAVELLASIGMTEFSRLPNKDTVSGKDVFAAILPKDFSFKGKSKGPDKNGSDEVEIKDGRLVKGVMDRANLGEGSGLMLRNIRQKYGPEITVKVLEDMFALGIKVLLRYGFTAGISDTDLPEHATAMIEDLMKEAEGEVDKLILMYNDNSLEVFPGRSTRETLELKILELLNKARNEAGKIVQQYADKKAHTLIMAESGSRGNIVNLAQMAACVGQQAMRGKRIEKGYLGRTLSSFKKDDLGPKARGFIRYGFKHGLTPYEFFFGAMTGRDSLMDTALRTPKSGYLYRRLSNALQDLKIEYDDTVRDASKKIIQFQYGEDGIDVSKSEGGTINIQKIIEAV